MPTRLTNADSVYRLVLEREIAREAGDAAQVEQFNKSLFGGETSHGVEVAGLIEAILSAPGNHMAYYERVYDLSDATRQQLKATLDLEPLDEFLLHRIQKEGVRVEILEAIRDRVQGVVIGPERMATIAAMESRSAGAEGVGLKSKKAA